LENNLEIQCESGSVPFALDMLTTGATSATKRPRGGVGARKFAVAILSILLLFAGFFATAQRASADTGIPPSGATGAMTDSAAGVPPGSTTAIPPPAAGNDATAAPVDTSQPTAQDAATAQAATADAAAAQAQQSNAIGATRADSSGDDSASQQNDVSVVGAAANGASTDQTAGSPSPAGSQQAATDQAANAAAAAVQPQQSNVVIIIRINSPGDDVVSQTNVVSVVAVAANQSSTSQNPAPAPVSAPATADPTQSTSGGSTAPSSDSQPVQSGGQPAQSAAATQQPQQPADAVQQPHRQPVRALSILAFAASSTASLPTPEHKATSSTTSASRPRAEGAAGRSGVFGPNTAAAQSDRASVASDGSSIQAARPQTHRAQGSRGAVLGAVRDRVANWLGRTGSATHPQLPAESARGMSLGLMTLTALLVGLLGWAALNWPVFRRR
jgi:type IV secretory pathway VirB10-like protein